MASLPAAHPSLSIHLTDPALTPLVSSSSTHPPQPSSPKYRALTDITTASLAAFTSSTRLGLGLPLRIMIETSKNGPVILHSFLNPQPPKRNETETIQADDRNIKATTSAVLDQTREALRPLSGSSMEEEAALEHSASAITSPQDDTGENTNAATIANTSPLANGLGKGKEIQSDQSTAQTVEIGTRDDSQLPPLLIATVVAPANGHEARRATGRLERLGVEFQRRWVEEQELAQPAEGGKVAVEGEGDGPGDDSAEGKADG